MLFNRFGFLFVFLPAVLALFFTPALRRWRPHIVLAASLVFYGVSGLEHVVILMLDVLWVYAIASSSAIVGSRIRVSLAVVPPLLALGYYKYLGLLIRTALGLGVAPIPEGFDLFSNILLPAGISFFTFELVSFAVDRYRADLPKPPSLVQFGIFISFFPHLVAGPILRYRDVAAPIEALTEFRPASSDVSIAIAYICLGLAAKVLIADTFHEHLKPFAASPGALSSIGAVYVVFAYSFQIYFDFYGYSLVAIGLARLFGFHFPQNFDRPYEALNPREFWRRWHITLSYWIRDYLYFPLGGNRAYVRNILIVFALCGLWHGAGWTFVAWGLYHAALVILYHRGRRWWDPLPALFRKALTFVLVSFGWTLFLFDFQGIQAFGKSLIGNAVTPAGPDLEKWIFVLIAGGVCYGLRFERMAEAAEKNAGAALVRTACFALLFAATLLFVYRSQDFIYFRF